MATRPATAPAAAPSTLGWPLCAQETVIQVSAAMAVAVLVTTKAEVAKAPEVRAEPALKPNQPNQSSEAPSTVMVASCGSFDSPSSDLPPSVLRRGPSTQAATNAETPEEMWT